MRTLIVCLIRIYQRLISPMTPARCRFSPTCSQYAVEAVQRFGPVRGLWLAGKRLVKCGPWHKGGYDPVPHRDERVGPNGLRIRRGR